MACAPVTFRSFGCSPAPTRKAAISASTAWTLAGPVAGEGAAAGRAAQLGSGYWMNCSHGGTDGLIQARAALASQYLGSTACEVGLEHGDEPWNGGNPFGYPLNFYWALSSLLGRVTR